MAGELFGGGGRGGFGDVGGAVPLVFGGHVSSGCIFLFRRGEGGGRDGDMYQWSACGSHSAPLVTVMESCATVAAAAARRRENASLILAEWFSEIDGCMCVCVCRVEVRQE